ncbi:6-hydroxy-3-succinoylpyridine 3-monooxygenase HspA [compost metagenome]
MDRCKDLPTAPAGVELDQLDGLQVEIPAKALAALAEILDQIAKGRAVDTDLVKLAHWTRRHINSNELAACQLPRVIQGKRPTTKPESWYGQPELLQEILELAIPVRGNKAAVFK